MSWIRDFLSQFNRSEEPKVDESKLAEARAMAERARNQWSEPQEYVRPQNYFGSNFYPDEYFEQPDAPRKEHLSYLEDNILNQTRKAGLPDAVVATQWATEGGRTTNPQGNNPFGLGPGLEYDSLEDATQSYIITVLRNSGLGEEDENGNLRLKSGVTADELVEALAGRYEMHMEDKNEYGRNIRNTPEWRFYLNNQGGFR